jgi:hypothetical protein
MTGTPAHGEPHRTPEIDEVFRRIGRNLLLFQHIEHLLKRLMASARLEGTVHSMQNNFDQRRARIHKQTLGQLAGQYVDDVLADAGEREAPENVDQVWLSFGFTIQADSAFVEQHTAEMKALVDARNDLIHHFLPRWSPVSEESTLAALAYLDEQRAQALPMRDRLQGFANSLQEAAKAHADFLSSPEAARQIELHWLQHSRLVLMLGEVAQRTPRADGWTVLASAGHIVRQREPEELEHMQERYGQRTLKRLLQATELFDIEEEPTPRGGMRTVYRINPRFELQIQPGQPTDSDAAPAK